MKIKRKRIRSSITILKYILCILIIILVIVLYKVNLDYNYEKIKSKFYKSAMKFLEFEEQKYENTLQIDAIKKIITRCNQEEKILNRKMFGRMNPEFPVIVIFVDKYKANFKYLLASLQHVVGIANVLIIFSHSRFDENVNSLIKAIDFARVIQIYYPYSLQVHPDKFPGYQKGDCTPDMAMDTAKYIRCRGAKSPDIHGRYRDPVLSQMKHFWWWTMNHVFEKLSHTKNHKGIFIFLEDDLFLMHDFIYMMAQMKHISSYIFQCNFISLQTSEAVDFYDTKTYSANIRTWDPKQHSGMLAFDSRLWDSISAHYYLFCEFDDYSWSRTLFYLSLNRKDGNRFKVITSTIPRAYKTSGRYDQFQEYTILNTVYEVLEMQTRNYGSFFPKQIEVFLEIELEYDDFVNFDYVDNNGRWSDPRDKMLCVNMTENKVKKIILDMRSQFNHYKNDDDIEDEADILDVELPGKT